MMDQKALTVVAPILPDQLTSLDLLLTEIGTNLRSNPYLDISKLSTTHFMRWVILPPDGVGPSLLLFESNHDGDSDGYLRSLSTQAGTAIDAIYSKCVGFPTRGVADTEDYIRYMNDHSLPAAAFYIGYRGRTVQTVQSSLIARQQIATLLDTAQASQAFADLTPDQVGSKIQSEATAAGVTAIAPLSGPPSALYGFLIGAALVGLGVGLTKARAWLPVLALAICFGAFLRWREARDKDDWMVNARPKYLPSARDNAKISLLAVKEDILAQNQLTHVVRIKPGIFRMAMIKAVLSAINLLAKIVFNKGSLGGIPTIHFARWVILSDRRLVFFSNYDGSWDNYLSDFVDRASVGLTGVWSNTEDFPPAMFLLFDGARRIEFFKAWTRAHQIPTQVWYSAYPSNSVINIRDSLAMVENIGNSPAGHQFWGSKSETAG